MLISINGSFEAPNGCVFELAADTVQHGLLAAFAGISGKVCCNLDATPFKYAPQSADLRRLLTLMNIRTIFPPLSALTGRNGAGLHRKRNRTK